MNQRKLFCLLTVASLAFIGSASANTNSQHVCYGQDAYYDFKVVIKSSADGIENVQGHAKPVFAVYRDFEFDRGDLRFYQEEPAALRFQVIRNFSQNPFFPEKYHFSVQLPREGQNEWLPGTYSYRIERGDENIRLGGDLHCSAL